MEKTTLKVSEIKNNPNNPRFIKDDNFKKLVQSIKDFPEMLDTREVVVNKDYIILGGNMRFKAAKEAGLKEVPVKIVDWDEDKQAILDWHNKQVEKMLDRLESSIDDGKKSHSMAVISDAIEAERNKLQEEQK